MAAEIVFSGAAGLLLGILSAGFSIGLNVLVFLLIPIIVLFFFKRRTAVYLLAVFIFLLAGNFYFHFYKNYRALNFPEVGAKITIDAVLVGEPKVLGNYAVAPMELQSPYAGTMELMASPSLVLKYGDRVEATGKVLEPQNNIDLPSFMAYSVKVTGEDQGFPLKAGLLNIKNSAVGIIKKYLSPQSSALMAGLIFGERSSFTDAFKNDMRLSGTTHLVALSGYNIGILVIALNMLLGSYLSRKLRFAVLIVAIVLFVIMVGGEASVVRAALMGALVLLAKEIGRIYSVRQAIAVSAAGMAVWNPFVLWDLGFLLSFLSLIGLVYLSPVLAKIFKMESKSALAQNFLQTTSAQLAVLPVVINYFSSFSVMAILANVFVLSFVPIIMAFGFVLVLVGWLLPFLAFIAGFFAEIFLRYMTFVISFFAKVRLPFGDFLKNIYFSVIYYLGLISLIYYVERPRPAPEQRNLPGQGSVSTTEIGRL